MNMISKRLTAALLLLLAGGALHAEGVVFFEGTWEEALAKAAKENKYIMLDAYTEWCGWCKVMDQKTFPDPEVGTVVNENFIPIKIDFEKGIGLELGMKFRVNSYPTTLFFNPKGQLVHVNEGFSYDNQIFIDECRTALAVKEERVYAFDSRDLKVPFPEFYRKSFLPGKERVWPKDQDVITFLNEQKDLFSEVSWSVMWRFGGGQKYEEFLMVFMDKYEKLYGHQAEEAALNIIQKKVFSAAEEKDEKMLDEAVGLIDQYFKRADNEKLKLIYRQFYFERIGDWKRYAETSGPIIAMENYSNPGRVNTICWTLYEKTDDPQILTRAMIWMRPIIELHETYAYWDTYAALLFKTGDKAGAEKYARLAIEKGKEQKEDVTETEKLLKRIMNAEL